ncbi:MAG: peptidylprolyl isomerase [Chromatiales bacterium]|nr:peptidylprolyl isomerase [Chromatiales bacterium]
MRKSKIFSLTTAASLLLVYSAVSTAQSVPPEKTLISVNGEAISQALYQGYYSGRQAEREQPLEEQERIALLNELVNYTLLAQDATVSKLDQQPHVAAKVLLERRKVLASAAIKQYFDNNPITEQTLKARYAEQYEKAVNKEYKTRHILLETKQDAESVLSALKEGGDFSELAKSHSKDTSATSGGDLAWFSTGQLLPEIEAAVAQLQTGSYTPEPVKTDFGWHIVILDETRNVAPPNFSEMRGVLLQEMKRAQLNDYIRSLREKANIEFAEQTAKQ